MGQKGATVILFVGTLLLTQERRENAWERPKLKRSIRFETLCLATAMPPDARSPPANGPPRPRRSSMEGARAAKAIRRAGSTGEVLGRVGCVGILS